MKFFKNIKDNCLSFFQDHPKARSVFNWSWKLILLAITCLIYSYGFRAFIAPTQCCVDHWSSSSDSSNELLHIISGGAGGLSQTIIRIIKCFPNGAEFAVKNEQYIQAVLYFVINVPLLVFAFLKISKKFAIVTLFVVGLTSIFNAIIPDSFIYNVIDKVIYDDVLIRCICAGITTGISSGVAMVLGTSAGGGDIISIYFSEKKSVNAGKFLVLINVFILFLFTLFSIIGTKTVPSINTTKTSKLISFALYSIIYFVITSVVVDIINRRNKKVEMQIITEDENLSSDLIKAFPHACTILNGIGAYSGNNRFVLYMVISKDESRKATKFLKIREPKAFITITDINQVYGRFYIKPLD